MRRGSAFGGQNQNQLLLALIVVVLAGLGYVCYDKYYMPQHPRRLGPDGKQKHMIPGQGGGGIQKPVIGGGGVN